MARNLMVLIQSWSRDWSAKVKPPKVRGTKSSESHYPGAETQTPALWYQWGLKSPGYVSEPKACCH